MQGEPKRSSRRSFLLLIIGTVLGLVAGLLIPRWAENYLPNILARKSSIEGQVLAKVSDADRLLLRLTTTEGLILVTFTQKLKELDLLIEGGDIVTLALEPYQPFVEDPTVERVRRSPQSTDPDGGEIPSPPSPDVPDPPDVPNPPDVPDPPEPTRPEEPELGPEQLEPEEAPPPTPSTDR